MEHKKSGIENIKVLFGDFLDQINDSQSEILDKVDALEERVMLLQEEVARYTIRVEELEQMLVEVRRQNEQRENEAVVMFEADASPIDTKEEMTEMHGALEIETTSEPQAEVWPPVVTETITLQQEPILEQVPEMESIPDSQPQLDNDPGFLLEDEDAEVLMPQVEVKPIFSPDLESVPQPLLASQTEQLHTLQGVKTIEAPTPAGDLFSQAEVLPAQEKTRERKIILEAVRPDWYDWEVDYPAPYIENIAEGIGFNDRILFLKELFEGDEQLFRNTVLHLNKVESFQEAVEYVRTEFPQWNEQSDEVYRFYMNVRRKLRK